MYLSPNQIITKKLLAIALRRYNFYCPPWPNSSPQRKLHPSNFIHFLTRPYFSHSPTIKTNGSRMASHEHERRLKEAAGAAKWQFLYCPNCSLQFANSYYPDKEFPWALRLSHQCSQTKTTSWLVCTQCANQLACLQTRQQITRHNREKHQHARRVYTAASAVPSDQPVLTYFQ